MNIRTVLFLGLALSATASAGCGRSSTADKPLDVNALTAEEKAAFKSQVDQAVDEEKAHKVESVAAEKPARSAADEERAAQSR